MSDSLMNEENSYNSLLSMMVDKAFRSHGIKPGSTQLSKEEIARLVETVKILQGQAEKFVANPQKRVKAAGAGAEKFVPKKP